MFVILTRTVQFALKNFYRNLGLSLTTVFILVLTIVSVNTVFSVSALAQTALKVVESRVDISLLFKIDATEDKILAFKKTLEGVREVAGVDYLTRDQVLEQFKEKHKNNPDIIASLNELKENPLGASLVVRAETTKDYDKVLSVIENSEYNTIIEKKTFDDHAAVIKRLGFLTSRTQQTAVAVSIILTVIAFLIIFNTIRVNVYTHREEVRVMKLVGAGNWFVRGPFWIETILYSFSAVVLTVIIWYIGLRFIDPYIAQFFSGTGFSLTGYFNANFLQIFGGEFLAVAVLNVIATSLALYKYLRV
ncbi:MAG: hypothetical protein HY981_00055 [Candidatus Magasanikbacteria bacterium]|nr:hypothetical protein [Candidatus Magasanikbacteria bacterium]